MEKGIKHYCFGCKRKHSALEVGSWTNDDWKSKILNGKKIYWCRECIDCIGCKIVHHNDTGFWRSNSQGEVCGKWAKSRPPSMQQKIANMSPEEVMSGVQYGNERQAVLGGDSEDYSKVQAQQVKELKEAL